MGILEDIGNAIFGKTSDQVCIPKGKPTPEAKRITWRKCFENGDTLEQRVMRLLKNKKTPAYIVSHCLASAPKGYTQHDLEQRIMKTLRCTRGKLKASV